MIEIRTVVALGKERALPERGSQGLSGEKETFHILVWAVVTENIHLSHSIKWASCSGTGRQVLLCKTRHMGDLCVNPERA